LDKAARVDGRASVIQVWLLGGPADLVTILDSMIVASEGDFWKTGKMFCHGIVLLAVAHLARRCWRKMP
jgi:hypothetical protein